ncbi:MAG: serine protease, partial [Thermoguttaceae bacterium]
PDCRIPRGRQECLPHRDKDRGLLAPGCFFSHRIASLHHVILTCCVVFATLAASAVWADPYVNAASTFVAPHPAVVRVVAPDSDGVSYGSGSLVAVDETSGLIVTNWHVVRDAVGPIVIYFPDGFRSRGVLLRVDRDWDLAALAIRRPNVQPIPLASQTPRPGDPLTIIGYGSGSYRVATGRCTEYVSPGGNNPAEMVELSAPARNGDSGGPILNTRGELAGVLFGTASGCTTGSYCGRLRGFLASVEGDFRALSKRVMLADQSRSGGLPVIPVGLANERPIGNPAGDVPPPTAVAAAPLLPLPSLSTLPTSPTVDKAKETAADRRPADPGRACSLPGPATASNAGTTSTADQIKTILALIGVVAVLYQGMRLLGAALG